MTRKGVASRLLMVAVVMLMATMVVSIVPMQAHAASAKMTLDQLQEKFPAGRYWNGGNVDKTTTKACTDHKNGNGVNGLGGARCNWFHDKSTGYDLSCCWGFAFKLGYDAFGTYPGSWTKKSNLNDLKPGDIVRYKNGSHVVFITWVDGNNIKYADCNIDYTCKIRWNVSAKKSDIPITNYKSSKMVGDGVYSAPSSLAKTFTVKYNANGGSGTMKNTTVTYGISKKLRKNTFTRQWYTFSGWNLYKHSSKKWYYTNGSTSKWYKKGEQPSGYKLVVYSDQHSVRWTTSVDKDVIEVYAVWTPTKTFTVKYNANGGTGTMANSTIVYGVGDYLRPNTFKRSGYTFQGWNLYKHSTDQWYYTNGSESDWYAKGEQPSGYELSVYKDQAKVRWTTDKNKDVIEVFAVWAASSTGTATTPSETETGAAVSKGVTGQAADSAITSMKSDEAPAGSKFGLLKLKSTTQTKASVKITWKKVSGAKKYVIYGNKCGTKNTMKKLATTTKLSKTFKKVAGKKVAKGKYYKFLVVALDKDNNVVSTSKTIHVATKGGKVGNDKRVTTSAKNNRVTVNKGKTFKLKAKAVAKSKRLTVKRHRGIVYESSNTKVATVSQSGVIKGKKAGTCYVYAYTQNGVCAKVKVTVK
ncbi:MAG: InlB B-repeat-containing protein [Coriobacteriia bacterium]|nr:InlB B-repeat-containing protein [Coriobacteriia bacterium]